MIPLAQSKKTAILPLLISLALVISGCQTYPSLHIVRSFFVFSPMVVPKVATDDLLFNVVVKNGATTDSPAAFLAVKTSYTTLDTPSDTGFCQTGTKYFKIPALKPGETRDYSSLIKDLGATMTPDIFGASYPCTCKKWSCVGKIRFTLHKAAYVSVGAQMTGPNTSLEITWDFHEIPPNEVTDFSQ